MAWDDFQVFLAVHRGGSHARAARALRVDPTTIGRRVAALEAEIGARLFDRLPTGLALTGPGAALLPRAERIEAEVLSAHRELQGADARIEGAVRVTAGDAVSNYILVPELVALRRSHPGLSIELRTDQRVLDLSRREADVAVRLTKPTQPALVARRVGTMCFSLYASQAYLERRGVPKATRDLVDREWIGLDSALDDAPQMRWLRRLVPRPRWTIRANTTATQVAACAAGHGIATLPRFVAPHEPRLVPVLRRLTGPTREAWVVMHGDMRSNARVALVIDWLARVVGDALREP